jgi:hypothetical protein
MSLNLSSYLTILKIAVENRDGLQLAAELALPLKNQQFDEQQKRIFADSIKRYNVSQICSSNIHDSNLSLTICSRISAIGLLCCEEYSAGKMFIFILHSGHSFELAFRHVLAMHNSAVDFFGSKEDDDTSWFIPVLIRISNDLRMIATMVLCCALLCLLYSSTSLFVTRLMQVYMIKKILC